MKEIEKITLFYEISNALNESLELEKSLYKVLSILSDSMDMFRGTVSILNPLTNEISIEVAHGISKSAMRKGIYKLGEGITGKVIQTGKTVTIPKISEEPKFLDRTDSRKARKNEELSFICVPVKKGNRVIGAISVDKPYDSSYSLTDGKKVISIVATMIATHVINLEIIRIEQEKLREENLRLKSELEKKYQFTNIIGNSNKMREVFQMISQVSRSNTTVLIRGESGTGKELVASSIHYNSLRAKQPFVKVNCAALPTNLIESELFGHEKGAFTGAYTRRKGRFEMAHGGTLLLDEIAETPIRFQAKLLRVLEQQDFERVGGNESVSVDVRIISTTNKDLLKEVRQGRFRQDLYYRLSGARLVLSPLRERKDDLSDLVWYFVNLYAREVPRRITELDSVMMDIFARYHWPGNVRQLRNVVRTSLTLGAGPVLSLADVSWLFDELQPLRQEQYDDYGSSTLNNIHSEQCDSGLAGIPLEQVEKRAILDTLRQTRGNQTRAAKVLGISDRTLRDRIHRYRREGCMQPA